jgi:exosortase/archaeosortase family protein
LNLKYIREFFTGSSHKQTRAVCLFALITLFIHYSYRFWANDLEFWPIHLWMKELHSFMTGLVFNQSTWVNRHILNIPMSLSGKTMYFPNGSGMSINESCAGDKQILQFVLLMLIYPGLWKRKLWYIPLGAVIVHFTNILRVVLLALVSANKYEWWHFMHNTLLRGMFYVVIFGLWVIWVKKVAHRLT